MIYSIFAILLGLLHYYLPMDEKYHWTLIGRNINGSVHGSTITLGPGVVNSSLIFRQDEGWIDLDYHGMDCLGNIYYCLNGLTLLMWIQPRFDPISGDFRYYFFHSTNVDLYALRESVYAVISMQEKQWGVATPLPKKGMWHHVAVTWSETGGLKLYLNGTLVRSVLSWGGYSKTIHNTTVTIGRPTSFTSKFRSANASYDELHFWNTIKDSSFILNLFKSYSEYKSNRSLGLAIASKENDRFYDKSVDLYSMPV